MSLITWGLEFRDFSPVEYTFGYFSPKIHFSPLQRKKIFKKLWWGDGFSRKYTLLNTLCWS